MKYYVIEKYYIGSEDLGDVDTIGIYTTPACDWWDKLPVIDGWAGTTNNWSTYGRGAYDTIDEARAKIDELYPWRREVEDNVVELYKCRKYAAMTRKETRDWLRKNVSLTGRETDDELRAIIETAESTVNDNGHTLHGTAFDILVELRFWRKKEA